MKFQEKPLQIDLRVIILILILSLSSTESAFSVTEDEKNNIAVYEKSGGWGGQYHEHSRSDGFLLQCLPNPGIRVRLDHRYQGPYFNQSPCGGKCPEAGGDSGR